MIESELPENFFRHEYGRLVAVLSRRVGVHNLEFVEDAVSFAMMKALELWTKSELPDNPSAWLYTVASNQVLSEIRIQSGRHRILEKKSSVEVSGLVPAELPSALLAGEIQDDLLRMLFVCCDKSIPVSSQLVLALKTLCGFSVREIASRLFASEAQVYKRLTRARIRLQELPPRNFDLSEDALRARLPEVRKILYLLFTEGHLSAHDDVAIRREMCAEAIRLASLLAHHKLGKSPESFALLALLYLHSARIDSRQDRTGGLLLLEEQDRGAWNQEEIATGLWWLSRSAEGEVFSRYHAEAGIAAEHCMAASFKETRWQRIVSCYLLLEQAAPSAIHRLNRAIATAEWQGPAAGLAVIEGFEPPSWLSGSYLWPAVLADLHRRLGNVDRAIRYRESALALAPTPALVELLRRRLAIG